MANSDSNAPGWTTPWPSTGERIESPAEFQEMFGRFQHTRMFDGGNDDSPGLVSPCSPAGNPENGEVIRLGPSACENQPVGLEAIQIGPEDFRYSLPGVFQ